MIKLAHDLQLTSVQLQQLRRHHRTRLAVQVATRRQRDAASAEQRKHQLQLQGHQPTTSITTAAVPNFRSPSPTRGATQTMSPAAGAAALASRGSLPPSAPRPKTSGLSTSDIVATGRTSSSPLRLPVNCQTLRLRCLPKLSTAAEMTAPLGDASSIRFRWH